MNNALLKAIGIGAGVFLGMMLIFWGISKLAGVPFFEIPKRPTVVKTTQTPTPPPFLK